ncbi:MAG: AEC family transporter [Sporomusaceae bacterium]|jgi:predicted permease|nr:AEC family transporter [Sporomusaceae bacterium]
MVFFHALQGLFIIIIIVSIGYFLTRKGWFTEDVISFLPKIVNYVALPAFAFCNIVTTMSAAELKAIVYGIVVPFLAIFLNLLLGIVAARIVKVPQGRRGIFLTIFFASNAMFIGLPVNLALFGEISIPFVLLYFFANTSSFWTVGNYLISKDGNLKNAKIFSLSSVKNILSLPFLASLIAVPVLFLEINFPKFFLDTLKYLGNMTTPLSLLFIGAIICGVKLKDIRFSKDVIAILIGRFILSPVLILVVAHFIPIPDLMRKVFVIQSALPAMALVTIIAKVHEADAEYSAILTAVTTVFSALAIPFYMVVI